MYWKKTWRVDSDTMRWDGQKEIRQIVVMELEWSGQIQLVFLVDREIDTSSQKLLAQTRSDRPVVTKINDECCVR